MDSIEDFLFYSKNNPLIFTNGQFWLFFFIVLLIFNFTYQKIALRNFFLLIFSLFFYYKSSGGFFILLMFTMGLDFTLTRLLHSERKKKIRLLYLLVSIIMNLGLLVYFKYTYFIADIIEHFTGKQIAVKDWLAIFCNYTFSTQINISKIILPVGISFYTFQSLSYCIDVYRKQLKPINNFLDFAFFVSFFPQLVAGPIVRATSFAPQVNLPYYLSKTEFNHAIYLISVGLFKKIVISDYISINFVDRVFDNPLLYTPFELLMGAYGYTIQIYCDFSGYTDIAIGLALLLGFRLSINFNSPYKASSITDFWRRWHISLSTWLRDYLYIPLGGNRKGKFRTYLNLIITMLLGGLWHGANLQFIVWGALHGFALAFEKLINSILPKQEKSSAFHKAISWIFTFHFVVFCWIFFRAPSVNGATLLIERIFSPWQMVALPQILIGYYNIFAVMLLGYLTHFLPIKFKETVKSKMQSIPVPLLSILLIVYGVLLFQMKSSEIQPFIYFQF